MIVYFLQATANVYGSQSEFVMMMGDSVIQVVEERNPDATLVAVSNKNRMPFQCGQNN